MAEASAPKVDLQRVQTTECRLSFPYLVVPRAAQVDGGKPKFTAELLFAKNDPAAMKTVEKAKAACKAAGIPKWGPDPSKWPKGLKMPFADGDAKADLNGYPGCLVIKCSSNQAPGIVNQKLDCVGEKYGNANELYAGVYVRADLRAYAWEAKGNKGISMSLENVQIVRRGDPFSGRKDPKQVFTVIANEDDDVTAGSVPADSDGVEFPF